VVGVVDDTDLEWIPNKPNGAPDSLDLGDVFEFDSSGGWIVRSQDEDHPFYLAAYMTGGGSFNGEGDPEWVNVVPTEQYLDNYVFFTDPTYPETSLVVVRRPGANDVFQDVELDCSGVLDGWQAVGDYEWTRVDMVTGNFQAVDGCENGRHVISSEGAFGVTVWGWGSQASQPFFSQYVSYAYPAGASIQGINEVILPQ
jgi:hypothetical protein